jgi:hypothetical protein
LAQLDAQIGKLSSHVLDRRLVQVVIARTSELIGRTVRESKFRTRFDAAIIALHREGNRQRKQIGDIQIAVRSSAVTLFGMRNIIHCICTGAETSPWLRCSDCWRCPTAASAHIVS